MYVCVYVYYIHTLHIYTPYSVQVYNDSERVPSDKQPNSSQVASKTFEAKTEQLRRVKPQTAINLSVTKAEQASGDVFFLNLILSEL